VEQIYRNTPWQHRWGIKFLCFGLGSLFAYDFYFFADALLFGRVDYGLLLARGVVNALVVPFIAVSVARNPQWSFDLSVSRSVVIHSTTLIATGVYLLFMALAGYYIRYYGGEWSTVFQPLFFFGAGLLLVVLLFSGQLRSRLKLFVNKHFFSYRYDYREEWLRLISVLSGQVLQATLPERIIFALAELVESPGGAIWIRAANGNCEFARCWNVPETEVDKRWDAASFCDALSHSGVVIDIDSSSRDASSTGSVSMPAWLQHNPNLWLVIPLFHEERLMGFVILSKARAPQALDWENVQLLQTAARQAASYLALDEAASALARARQFEGFNRLSAFVVHDLKNLVAQLSLITRNAERFKDNQAFVDDAFQTVSNSVDKMNRLLAQLRSAAGSGHAARVDLRATLERVISDRCATQPRPTLRIDGDIAVAVSADADRLSAVLGNVIQNAQEATPKDGRVDVRLSAAPMGVIIEVDDTGCGMDEAFVRDRLFQPFDSTKGLSGMGIGAYECREFVTMLGGRIEVDSRPGVGTRFSIFIPAELVDEGRAAVSSSVESYCKIKSPSY
jgi:putative PEP-CTERM system histidine kinase